MRGLYAYVSPMCNGEIRTYVVLPKRGLFVFVVFRLFRRALSSLLNVGGCETNTSFEKGFKLKSQTWQNDLMSWLILISEKSLILLNSFQVVYENRQKI